MVHNYENDSKAKNPYEAVVVGKWILFRLSTVIDAINV
jgi:hypothetical protein